MMYRREMYRNVHVSNMCGITETILNVIRIKLPFV